MGGGLQVSLTEARDRLPVSRAQWNALVAQSPTHTAFQTFEWFETWWSAFGASYRLFLLTVHRGDTIVGLAPLMLTRGPLGLRVLEFVGTPNADYQDLLVSSDRDATCIAIVEFLVRERRRWHMVVLRNLPSQSLTRASLGRACERLGLRVMDTERQPCPALAIRGREDEVGQLLNRYSIRRSARKLASRGTVRFQTLDTIEAIDGYLPAFFEQHARRWAGSREASPFNEPRFCDWYRALAHAAHRAGWLHFSVLQCAGTPAAFHFGFNYAGVLSWYKPSFNPDFAKESPGTTLIHHLIEDARARSLDELDFAGGLEPFKDRFSNIQRECLNFRIFRRGPLGLTFVAGARIRGMLRRALTTWRRRGIADSTSDNDSP